MQESKRAVTARLLALPVLRHVDLYKCTWSWNWNWKLKLKLKIEVETDIEDEIKLKQMGIDNELKSDWRWTDEHGYEVINSIATKLHKDTAEKWGCLMRNLEFYDSVPASNKFISPHTYEVIDYTCKTIQDVSCETLSFKIQTYNARCGCALSW